MFLQQAPNKIGSVKYFLSVNCSPFSKSLGSVLRNLPANAGDAQEMQLCSLGREDPLEEEMATHSSILAWEIPWTEEPGRLQPMWLKESDMTEHTHIPCLYVIVKTVLLKIRFWCKGK